MPRHRRRLTSGAALTALAVTVALLGAPGTEPADWLAPAPAAAATTPPPRSPAPPTLLAVRAAQPDDSDRVVDIPVSFTVGNTNRTRSQCYADGEEYTVRGHLTAPEDVLDDPEAAVTLLLHGTNTGEWIWRLDVDGHNYVRELAARGHASVTIDRLGYGSSDIPDGFASCSGAHADIAHQVLTQLRAGDYDIDDGSPVAFSSVVLGGHSSGALLAETVAASFGDTDGLLLTGWAAIGVTDDTNRRFLTAYETCLDGGEPHTEPDDPSGYVHFDPNLADFLDGGLGAETAPEVVAAVEPLWARNPCGVMISEPMGILVDLDLVADIDVPVHLVFGERDILRQGVEGYAGLFTTSPEVTELTLDAAGHFVTVDVHSQLLYDSTAAWLERHT